ncbi:hypothetical protein [Lentibacillus sp. Marseille-P4043]|uniref:hypothetical protein n=1 Tax=Lentibacillus sp. Marseille-P4043 TaxID=2040293 RepID=UPI000D0B07E6|nr:hypothetical protein [Lentibacillus sp. Marseille-P4043]
MYTFSLDGIRAPQNAKPLFYPYEVTQWQIQYKPFPFMKMKTENKYLITNLTRKETNFFEGNVNKFVPFQEKEDALILPTNYLQEERVNVSDKFLENYYIHKRKVWSYPKISLLNTYALFVPYFIYKKRIKNVEKDFLLEPSSGSEDLLDKYKEIQKYVQEQGVIT